MATPDPAGGHGTAFELRALGYELHSSNSLALGLAGDAGVADVGQPLRCGCFQSETEMRRVGLWRTAAVAFALVSDSAR